MTNATTSTLAPLHIVVSGDLVVDHHLYTGERMTPTARGSRGVRHVRTVGGAEGLRLLLERLEVEARQQNNEFCAMRDAAAERAADDALRSGKTPEEAMVARKAARETFPPFREPIAYTPVGGVELPDQNGPHAAHHAVAIWEPYALDRENPGKGRVWRANLKMGYGHEPIPPEPEAVFTPRPATIRGPLDLLVLDDAGFVFRQREHAQGWHLPRRNAELPWILLKLSDPIAQGDLWRTLVPSDKETPGYADQLVCLVAAHDLRRERVRITPGMSWERALEDLSDELGQPALAPLARCRHLVVAFGGDAVLWIDRDNQHKAAHFCFAPTDAEGDFAGRFDGEAVGYLTAMAAALGYGISQVARGQDLDIAPWMAAGLQAMRDLLENGHGPVTADPNAQPDGYPVERLAKVILRAGSSGLAQAVVAWPRPRGRSFARPWMIVESFQRSLDTTELPTLVGLAGEVIRRGRAAYGMLPHAQFGKFLTAERTEIEMLRGISRLMRDYGRTAKAGAKPLSIGVFGPPGAGKSFAVREISEEIFTRAAWLEFNLSQFNDNAELNGALHQVRDKVLEGLIPVVFWDEFDSRGFHWLQYLLAPMQDGRFQDGALTHAVGRSVFVFAGGTSRRWADFGRVDDKREEHSLKLLKVPDFKSRFDAYYDVSGPNPRWKVDGEGKPVMCGDRPCSDPDDIGFTLRRALLIRGQLGLNQDAVLSVDADLLRAVLLVPEYCHGARSLEKLMKSLATTPGAPLRRSALPPPALLDMYTDAARFDEILDAGRTFAEDSAPEVMASIFHEAYLKAAHADNWPIQPHIDKPFENLDASLKDDNIEAARRIPEVLALAGLGIESVARKPPSKAVDTATLAVHLHHNLERLAAAEHDGWWDFRRRNGWTLGTPRDDAKRIHPLMVPYAQLSEPAKDRDRKTVMDYPSRLSKAGYRIVWLTT